ncbi:hypothetical protein BGZ67_000162 [Mortierella alpina]|nr:hypothetical protein BGZ67_000162 [Mortierella alpina]
MHAAARSTAKAGSPLCRVALLKPSKAISLQHQRTWASSTHTSQSTSHARSAPAPAGLLQANFSTHGRLWSRRFQSTAATTASKSPAVQELEQLLAKQDYEAFQNACHTLQQQASLPSTSLSGVSTAAKSGPTKEVFHFLLRTLGENPKAFAPLSESSSMAFEPLESALGILTEMSSEANMLGNSGLQPDRETLLLVLKIAGSGPSSISMADKEPASASLALQRWRSARVLVDAVRHGRLPAVMSFDQWELPDLNLELDQILWHGLFECIHDAAVPVLESGIREELNTLTYLMADQLSRSQDVQMDDQLWRYVVEAFGNSASTEKLNEVLQRLPSVHEASPELSSTVAEALANCGSTKPARDILNVLFATATKENPLSSIRPLVSLARQYAKTGNYEQIRQDYSMWMIKGSPIESTANHHRSFLAACGMALDRIVKTVSRTFKDRQADILPESVLPGLVTPTQLSRFQFDEALYLGDRSHQSLSAIPLDQRTPEDYDAMMRIATRLNLLQSSRWPLQQHALSLLEDMKAGGLTPLKSTYLTLMETMARSREFGASREDGHVFEKVLKVFQEMTSGPGAYAPTSARDFQPLIESCFGLYSHSPFVAGQWMYQNQLYPVAMSALQKVESMMQRALVCENQDLANGNGGIQQYHDKTTLASVLAGLGHGDEIDELLRRWDDLALQGVERDAMLYQTVIGASQVQVKMSRFVLNKVRHDMLKEQPAISMTPEIFAGLLNCCVRAKDTTAARSLIAQYSTSGEIQKTAEWYVPMVRTCLMVEGMEDEGGFLLEEMKRHGMMSDHSTSQMDGFMEFLMEYFVMRRMDFQAGREVFKSFVKSEQSQIEELVKSKKKERTAEGMKMISDRELEKRAARHQRPVEHMVERIELSPRTASMLNLLVLSHIRERVQALEMEKRSGFSAGSQERLRDAQVVMHYLTGETKSRSHGVKQNVSVSTLASDSAPKTIPDIDSTISAASPPSTSSSLLYNTTTSATSPSEFHADGASNKGRLIFVNKYVLGEYIDTCIKEGSPEMLEEASWALSTVAPRVIRQARISKDTQRLRQALENAYNRGHRDSISGDSSGHLHEESSGLTQISHL